MRAHRYPLELPLRYRCVGDKTWIAGTTANISRSGVLFRCKSPVGVDSEIELNISLSPSAPAADIICRACVVRMQPSRVDEAPMVAAEFSQYRFEPMPIERR